MNRSRPSFATATSVLLSLILCATVARAQTTDPKYPDFVKSEIGRLPGQPATLIDGSDLSAFGGPGHSDYGRFTFVDVADQEFGKAIRVEILKQADPAYLAQILAPVVKPAIKKGDTLLVVYHVRCVESKAENGLGRLQGFLQLNRDPWTGTGNFSLSPGKDWRKIYYRTVAEQDYEAGTLQMTMHLAYFAQTLEIGGVAMFDFGPSVDQTKLPVSPVTYAGREPDAPWRREAAERIEKYRKGDLTVTVLDAAGRPVAGADVHARMTRHGYQFGTFLEGPALLQNADGEKYRETLKRLYNRVTCPVYWADWGWPNEQKKYLELAQWAFDNHFHIRGHNLIWPGWNWTPKSLRALEKDPDALRAAVHDSIAERITAFRKFGFDDYDVINELRDNHQIVDILGRPVIADWFKMTKEIDPKPRLGINEFSIVAGGGNTGREQGILEEQIRYLIAQGAPVGVIGFQCHFDENLTPPAEIVKILDRFAKFGLPLHATEFDIGTYDEAVQADYMRDFLTVFFSHPATEGITQWGFWEGIQWIPRAAMFRKDWSVKPSGQAFMDLVLKAWWTDTTGKTDAQGKCLVRGFNGDYEIAVKTPAGEKTQKANLTAKGAAVEMKF